MRKLWFFRGRTQFCITVLAVTVPSYYAYTIFTQSKFNNSIVDHSINLLSKNPEIKQILGAPLHYKSSTGSDYKLEDNAAYYSFRVGGPKGNLPVEVMAAGNKLSDVYNPSVLKNKAEQIKQLTSKIEQIKKSTETPESNQKIAELSTQISTIEKEIQQKSKIIYNRFYIVGKQNTDKLIEQRNSSDLVPEDWKVWAITNLQMNLPNGNKIRVIPNEKQSVYSNDNVSKWTFKNLHEKLYELPLDLTKQQTQQYNKQKSANIYNKYNTHRLVTFLFLGIGAISFFWYKSKYTLSSIAGTSLMYTIKSNFTSNRQIQKLGKYLISNNIQGGKKGQIVDAKVNVQGPKKGYIHILAKYQQDGSYKTEKMQFILQDELGKISKRININ